MDHMHLPLATRGKPASIRQLTPDHLKFRIQTLHALAAGLPTWQGAGQMILKLRLPVVALGLAVQGLPPGDVEVEGGL